MMFGVLILFSQAGPSDTDVVEVSCKAGKRFPTSLQLQPQPQLQSNCKKLPRCDSTTHQTSLPMKATGVTILAPIRLHCPTSLSRLSIQPVYAATRLGQALTDVLIRRLFAYLLTAVQRIVDLLRELLTDAVDLCQLFYARPLDAIFATEVP
jgi:hypothetical protein